jgi:exopolyphosphatase/guanosine-5'-triphosphate,3'-diphosphate pyrophosphatase
MNVEILCDMSVTPLQCHQIPKKPQRANAAHGCHSAVTGGFQNHSPAILLGKVIHALAAARRLLSCGLCQMAHLPTRLMLPVQALAAVDLGSNSFRLEIGTPQQHHMQRVDYLKETVRQGNGLDAHHNLTPEAMERGWACLARFGERLRGFDPQHVRAVATQTLREARNREVFVQRGSALLGFPIEVISGEEEAALIYRGVISQLPPSQERRLVIDIGGRSTEFVLGQANTRHAIASYGIGSVAWTSRHFPHGELSARAFADAQHDAACVLAPALHTFTPGNWDIAYASAGTANAVGETLAAYGQSQGVITREGLDWLERQLVQAGHIARVQLEGLKADRRPVLAGGLSVLRAVFDLMALDTMHIAQGALRMGLLYGLLDRICLSADVPDRSAPQECPSPTPSPSHASNPRLKSKKT